MPPLRNTLAGILMLTLAAYGGLKAALYYQAQQRVEAWLGNLDEAAAVDYERLSVSLFGPLALERVDIRPAGGPRISADRLVIRELQTGASGWPLRLRAGLVDWRTEDGPGLGAWMARRLRLSNDRFAAVAPGLEALDYRALSGQLELDWSRRPDRSRHELVLMLRVQEMGELRMRVATLDAAPLELLRGARQGALDYLVVDYREQALVERWLRLLAGEAGAAHAEDAVRRQLVHLVSRGPDGRVWNLGAENVAALERFLARPRRLELVLHPHRPVALRDLQYYRPEDLPALLNLQIRANRP